MTSAPVTATALMIAVTPAACGSAGGRLRPRGPATGTTASPTNFVGAHQQAATVAGGPRVTGNTTARGTPLIKTRISTPGPLSERIRARISVRKISVAMTASGLVANRSAAY